VRASRRRGRNARPRGRLPCPACRTSREDADAAADRQPRRDRRAHRAHGAPHGNHDGRRMFDADRRPTCRPATNTSRLVDAPESYLVGEKIIAAALSRRPRVPQATDSLPRTLRCVQSKAAG
jgi:hypothetical protein